MSQVLEMGTVPVSEITIESVLLDADLFVKYSSPEKAFTLLRGSLERSPVHSASAKRCGTFVSGKKISTKPPNSALPSSACISPAKISILRTIAFKKPSFLIRGFVAPGLEAIRRARRPDFAVNRDRSPQKVRTDVTFAGNLAFVSIFDAVQVIESSKMTGLLVIKSDLHLANVAFNEGKIVDAECNEKNGMAAFRSIVEINHGTFEFSTSNHQFPVVIAVSNNTNFLLDVLTELDNERRRETRAEKYCRRSGLNTRLPGACVAKGYGPLVWPLSC